MRVRFISVRKLFGRFDHTIALNQDERITIIHGPNGYGKTALLRLVHAAIHLDVDELRSIPFESLRVELDDGAYLQIVWNTHSEDFRSAIYRIAADGQVLSEYDWGTAAQNGVNVSSYANEYARARQEPVRPPSTRDLFEFLCGPQHLNRRKPEDFVFQKVWLHHVPVHVISVQRLLTRSRGTRFQRSLFGDDEGRDKLTFKETVTVYSDELRTRLSKLVRDDYASKSYELDSNFPMRVVEALNAPPVSDEQLQQRLQVLEQKRRWLDDLGIVPSEDIRVDIPASINSDAARQVLGLYVRDVEDKLAIFENLANRVSLLQDIINQRFQFKRLKIDAEQGFVFESDTGQELPPTALSSGEQHQLVMVYECLFKIEQNALLLIDEPELSLHVSWQVEFLHDLQRIIEIAEFDTVIATHSPQIIHDRWDLTVELQPPSEPPASITSEVPVVEQEAARE